MEIGVGLPTTIPGVRAWQLLEWSRAAEERNFSTLAVLDRLVFDNDDPIVTLAAAAAVTRRIRLATTILVAGYRNNAAVLAKELATLNHLSGSRLVVGVAAGNRVDDFLASGETFAGRGRRLDEQLTRMLQIWTGNDAYHIGPRPPAGGPVLLVGGHSPAALHRAARFGQGWISGAGSSAPIAQCMSRARAAWAEAGRSDQPLLPALAYFVLGPAAPEHAERYLHDYYAFLGPDFAARVSAGALTDKQRLRSAVSEHEAAGCTELILFPCSAEPNQLDLLAEALS